MRSGLNTILQTLTPEAASVLNHSIAEAGRRNHSQTTPLHVAATLLAGPTGFLRQACIRSHPNSSHPLQCRALELCFSVALERLPSASSSPALTEPPVSNALMAALKRAQAHQRRGCPEQQQQPLLAVKVELEQLIISILDDPSVSRVMREASFSSPAVKATIEKTLNNNIPTGNHLNHIGFRPSPSPVNPVPIPINRNLYYNPRLQRSDETSVSTSSSSHLYLNPRLQQQKQGNLSLNPSGQVRIDDIRRVIEVMSKSKKKNPILVGEFEPELIKKEILMRIQRGELLTEKFKNAEVISMEFPPEKSKIPSKIKELSDAIETRLRTSDDGGGSNRSIIIDLDDLKWLVEQPPTADVSDIGRQSVAEMAKLATKFTAEECNIWFIGTASCETYLRCQVYHPSMENDWDLQALPISSRSPFSGRNVMSSVESLNSLMNFTNPDSARMPSCCSKCYRDYEEELAKLNNLEKSSVEAKTNLPQWLQNAKAQSGETETDSETKMPHRSRVSDQELQKKWSDICSRIHPNDNQISSFGRMGMGFVPMYKPNPVLCQSQMGQQLESPPSPVRTELVLGPKEVHKDLPVKDYLGCISFEGRFKGEESPKGKFVNSSDTESFKKLLKSLMKKAWWQPEAASIIATTVTHCGSRGGALLFAGPDRMGKKKMARVLAEHVCRSDPITICLGSRLDEDEMDFGFRGKTVLDRIVEAVRRNPFSVIVLSDIDEADMLVRASIKKAMERGRLTDSHGREISLGNIILVLTGNWSTNKADQFFDEKHRLHSVATGDWQLKLTISEKRSKRQADWLSEENISKKQKKVGSELSLDLNLAVDAEEDRTDTSDLTTEQGEENSLFAFTSVPHELVGMFDATIVFKPVQSGLIRREIKKTIKNTFTSIVNQNLSIEVDEATLDNMLSRLWLGRTGLEDWADQVLVPSFHKLMDHLPSSDEDLVVRLESVWDNDRTDHVKDRLPSKVNVILDTV